MPNSPLSIVFLGTSAFAVPSLHALVSDPNFDVKLVITQPDRPVGRKQLLTSSPVKVAAQKRELPVIQPENIHSLPDLPTRPDFLVVVSYGQILSQEILDLPTTAAVNLHASLLPLLRGASPLQHAILQNLPTSGVTVQRMVKELDAGPILAQLSHTLDADETFTTLHNKLANLGADLLVQTLSRPLKEKMQDASQATFCRKLTKKDGISDPASMSAQDIDRRVRALTPWPGVSVHDTKLLETSLEPSKEALSVPCANGTTLYVSRIQSAGGKPMSGADFVHGNKTL